MPTHVTLNWKRISWEPTDTWAKCVVPKLDEVGVKEADLGRSVYVIRLNGNFCVGYPKLRSPTVYIGEGNFKQRIDAHREWVGELKELIGAVSFDVRIATPRVRNNPDAYLDVEAALLERSGKLFGTAPLWNKQFESRRFDYTYDDEALNSVLTVGRGTRYRWAITPMPSCSFHDNFHRTHVG
jgi:hypothetical protein